MEEYRKINSEHYISFRLCSFSVQFFIFCETVWVLFIYAHTHIYLYSCFLYHFYCLSAFFRNQFLKFLTILCVIFNLIQYL